MRWVALGCCLSILACSSTTPGRTQYLLRAAEPASHVAPGNGLARIALGRITVAPYLDQFGIVVETDEREVRAARNHQWAEPLADGLRLYLRDAIADVCGEDVATNVTERSAYGYVVDVFVEQLHGTRDGRAVLVASYRIETPGSKTRKLVERRFAEAKAIEKQGYAGLVDIEVQLLGNLADAIGAEIPKAAR
jgi:uncharacterized lipoprotein YmbA